MKLEADIFFNLVLDISSNNIFMVRSSSPEFFPALIAQIAKDLPTLFAHGGGKDS